MTLTMNLHTVTDVELARFLRTGVVKSKSSSCVSSGIFSLIIHPDAHDNDVLHHPQDPRSTA
jgi:hypothetical protein